MCVQCNHASVGLAQACPMKMKVIDCACEYFCSQEIHEGFDIKQHVLGILKESGKADTRAKNMEVDAFLRSVCE